MNAEMIELEDIADDVLITELKDRGVKIYLSASEMDTDDLESEIEDRGYTVLHREPSIEDFDFDDVCAYVESNGYCIEEGETLPKILENLPPYELRDVLCDLVGVNHHTSKEDILKLIAEKI